MIFCKWTVILAVCLFLFSMPACAQEMTAIGYTDGTAEDGMWLSRSDLGHGVVFTAPAENWTLSKVAVCGMLNPSGSGLLVLEIWDEDLNAIYRSTDLAAAYFGKNLSWSEIDIPDLAVPDTFLVCLFEFSSVYVGVDLSNESQGTSFVAGRNANRILPWGVPFPRNSTEWTISAIGYSASQPPQGTITVEERPGGLAVKADVWDGDGDLAYATVHFLNNSSGDVVWSERRRLNGTRDDIEFLWSGKMLAVSNRTLSLQPIYALNALDVSPEESPFSSYYARVSVVPALEDAEEIPVAAFFGQDGRLTALDDGYSSFFYLSPDRLKLIDPKMSYADYMKNNLSLAEFRSGLIFTKLNVRQGLERYPVLILSRSPLHGFGLEVKETAVPMGDYTAEVVLEDFAGNAVRIKP